jgi:hypothetical protein
MALRGRFTPHGGGEPEPRWDPARDELPAYVTLWVEPPDHRTYTIELLVAETEEHWVQRDWKMEVGEGRSETAVLPQDLAQFVRLQLHASGPVAGPEWTYFLRRPPGAPPER